MLPLSIRSLSSRHLYFLAVFGSLLLSCVIYLQPLDVGTDGVLYLRAAAAYNNSGFTAAMALYPWPFYSIVIAYLHKTGLSYVNAGYWLDAFLQAAIAYFFVRIILHFKLNMRLGLWAVLCILCYSTLNDQRGLLYRDFGYWSCYLMGLWAALTFLTTAQQRYLWLFGLATLLATLFRVEGVLITATIVLVFFFTSAASWRQRGVNSIIMAWPFIIMALIFAICGSTNLHRGGRLQEVLDAITHIIPSLVASKQKTVALLRQALLPTYVYTHIESMYFCMLIGFFAYKIVMTTQIYYSSLIVYSWIKPILNLTRRQKYLIYSCIAVQLVMLFIFLVHNLFLTGRYVLALSLLLLLWAPFGLEQAYVTAQKLCAPAWRWSITTAISILFIFSLLHGFVHTGPSKQHLYNASTWLQARVQPHDRILTNSKVLLYNVKGAISTWDQDLLATDKQFDCNVATYKYVIVMAHSNSPPLSCRNLTLVKSFYNNKKSSANIYAVN